jgi:hypothetical protein
MMRSFALVVFAASTLSAPALAGFGQLSYQGSPIPMTSGTGVGNDGYYYSGGFSTQGSLLIGIKAHEYRTGNNPAGTSTESALAGGGSWLNLDSQGRYTALAGVAANTPSWNPNAPRWGFTWSITMDGARPGAGVAEAAMTITRPDGVPVAMFSGLDAGGNFGGSPANPIWQNNWNLGYLGVFGNGVDANTLGEWKIRIDVSFLGTSLGSQEITVNVIPAPGALALLGAAGLSGLRRRR